MASKNLIQALAVTAELCGGTQLSDMAARAFLDALGSYPESAVIASLNRCRKELTGRLTLAAVIQRIPGGRPGAEEAWAIASKGGTSESVTKIWTTEIFTAFLAIEEIYNSEGPIPARMAFKEIYAREVAEAEAAGRPVEWKITLGHNVSKQLPAIESAIQSGYITAQAAPSHLRHLLDAPKLAPAEALRLVVNGVTPMLEDDSAHPKADPEVIDKRLRDIRNMLKAQK